MVEVVGYLATEHLDACVAVDDLCRGNNELFVFEELVEEPDGCDLPKGYATNVVDEDLLFLALVLYADSWFASEEIGFIGWCLVAAGQGLEKIIDFREASLVNEALYELY